MSTVRALGLDAGSTTVKIVAVGADGGLLWHRVEDTDPSLARQLDSLVRRAEEEAGAKGSRKNNFRISDAAASASDFVARRSRSFGYATLLTPRSRSASTPSDPGSYFFANPKASLVVTGYGRNLVTSPHRKVTEITCHAAGVFRSVGHGGTLIDIGGQDTKVIVIDGSGKVLDFAMNDKCAAGTGRFLEVCARRLGMSLDDLAAAALSADGEVSISTTCTVFAESEIVSLIARGEPVPRIVRGIFRAMLKRVVGLARGIGMPPPVMLSGGVAKSAAVEALLSEELSEKVRVPSQPQLMGAYGAAVLGLE